MSKRVAITIAGAVSLGSYEAGVVYELLEAIRLHNEAFDKAGSTNNTDEKIYVDVITGASAGGMTAAMLAQWLMFRGSTMSGVDSNPLYDAWVKRISLKGLVHLDNDEPKWHSLFSSNLIAEIGKQMLVDPMKNPSTGPHPCLEPGAPLRIGLALTNLNGINYVIPIEDSKNEGFNYTRSVDQRLFTVLPQSTDGPELVTPDGKTSPATWQELSDAAVACGAFPFAFRPRRIERDENEYVNSVTPLWPGKATPEMSGTTFVDPGSPQRWDFAYTDGGVLQNQPLGVAKDLVDASVGERLVVAKARKARAQLDVEAPASSAQTPESQAAELHAADTALGKVHRDADERLYIFISPNEVKSTADHYEANKISLAKMLPAVASVYLRQAQFHDWIMAEGVNQNIKILDNRAKDLAAALQPGGGIQNVQEFEHAADNLDDLLLGDEKDVALERLRHQYIELYDSLAADPGRARAFLLGIAALEAAAHLGDRDKMHIFAVLADGKNELAGSGIAAFVGFFSETFREHDYRVGRKKAREYLVRDDVSGLLGLDAEKFKERYAANPVQPMNPPLTTPLPLATALKAGAHWVLYAVWIRIPKLAIAALAAALLAIYLLLAHAHDWFPFVY
jgi:predicted acylesterase/phospholipase RssA